MNIFTQWICGCSVGFEIADPEHARAAGDKWCVILDLFIIRFFFYNPVE